MIFIKSFFVGGIICAIVQIFIDKTKLTPGRIMVGLVSLGVILGAIGIYEPFQSGQAVAQQCHYWALEIICGRE